MSLGRYRQHEDTKYQSSATSSRVSARHMTIRRKYRLFAKSASVFFCINGNALEEVRYLKFLAVKFFFFK